MKRLKTVEPVWVTWQEEPGKFPIKVGELVSVDNGDGTATVRRFDEYVTVEIELLRPEPAEVTGQKLRAFADALKALEASA